MYNVEDLPVVWVVVDDEGEVLEVSDHEPYEEDYKDIPIRIFEAYVNGFILEHL